MKYLCLVYLSPEQWNSAPDEACMACGNELRASGHFITGTPLHPTHTATTVRVRNGQLAVTDGPFAETKEQLAGFYLIEARDLNEAIQIASKIPPAQFGSIEVRPTRELVGEHPTRRGRRRALNPTRSRNSRHALADFRQSPGQGPEALRGFLHEARLHVQPHVHRRQRDLHDPRRQPVRDAAGREILRHLHQPRPSPTPASPPKCSTAWPAAAANTSTRWSPRRAPAAPRCRASRRITASCTPTATKTSTATPGNSSTWLASRRSSRTRTCPRWSRATARASRSTRLAAGLR